MNGEEKLKGIRDEMSKRNYDAYIIPHGDQHDNEYIAESDERIRFISNFSGSNGLGLVTQNVALMWTDGRYYLQIEKELYPGWQMKKMEEGQERLTDYIMKNLPVKSKISMDFNCFSKDKIDGMTKKLNQYEIIDDDNNLIDTIWKDKPSYSKDKVLILPVKYTGLTPLEKYSIIGRIIKEMISAKSKAFKKIRLLISTLDDIAWLTNLRGNDIPYNPVFFSFALLYINEQTEFLHLFSEKDKYDFNDIKEHLTTNKITLHDYKDIYKVLSISEEDTLTVFDSSSTNMKMYKIIEKNKEGTFEEISKNVVEKVKSIKNKTELKGYVDSSIRDSAALVKFFAWLENEVANKKTPLNEYEIGVKNKQFREEQALFMGESFPPICGAGPNAAIIHYEQTKEMNSPMTNDKIILCDTGAQYLDGTTDVTRTVHNGTPSQREKEMYTRVLLGNLSLQRLTFKPNRTRFSAIDKVARSFLNQVGLDYNHGTTHGVGHFLNVHEGPYEDNLEEGNVITNEPGYYEPNAFGIRIENMIVVVKKEDRLGFENITLVPYERNLMDYSLISPDMLSFINDYHKKIREVLEPLLKEDEIALDYLKRKTALIQIV